MLAVLVAAAALLVPAPAPAVTISTLKIGLSRINTGLDSPVAIAVPGDGTGRIFVAEQPGRVRVRRADGTLAPTPFLDIRSRVRSGGERGLLGLAFHPSYKSNGYFFAAYTDSAGALVVARFRASPSSSNTASSSQTTIITVPHPTYGNHNGGQIAFGPDGFLYVGTGDGGGAGDPEDNGQDRTTLLGKILRLDVNRSCSGANYCIPSSNPYASSGTMRKEIWQYGLRNPWRFSFDRSGGALWIADVGQGQIEEVSRIAGGTGGRNFGWDCWEGTRRFKTSSSCPALSSTVRPVTQYDHSQGDCAVIGGFVYRGKRYAANMGGVYLYGDYCTGFVRAYLNGATRIVLDHSGAITSFGEDAAGELYAVDAEGRLFRVTASGGVTAPPPASPSPTPKPTTPSPSPSPSPTTPSPTPTTPSPTPTTPSPTPTTVAAPPAGESGSALPWVLAGAGIAAGAAVLAALRLRRGP